VTSRRNRLVLRAVVQEYIRTAEPVGSKALAAGYDLGVSPATIRNVMGELERDGYLIQPYTSAGRVPTDKGFRAFVDGLVDYQEPLEVDKEALAEVCSKSASVEGVLTETARALSAITSCAGLMFVPRNEWFVIKHINILPMDSSSVMVVIVSTLGMVRTRHIRLDDESVEGLNLERISNYLNTIARGLTLRGLRRKLVEEMSREKSLYDRLMASALSLASMAVDGDGEEEGELYLEGRLNILDQPEFRDDFKRMREIFTAFEEKSLLVRILDKSLEEEGLHIYLGSETPGRELDGLSVVTATYGEDARPGTLGVVGPVRMDYQRIIPLVEYAAGLLDKSLG